jgi:two-component system, LytTR family, sensor kinase
MLVLMMAWAVPGLISMGQYYVAWASFGNDVYVAGGFCTYFVPWQVWAFATPLVVVLGRRLPLSRRRWWMHLPVHLACNAFIAVTYVTVQYAGGRATGLEPFVSYAPLDIIPQISIKSTVVQSLLYWGVIAADRGLAYQRRYREAELHRAQLEARLVEAQLDALRGQLQPHFLFNTLNAISVLMRKGDSAASVRMLAGLSELLRRSLSSLTQERTLLRDELDFLGHYLDIQRVRFPDRLRVDVDAEPAAMAARVPSLFLQPLVENAIEHGVGPRASGGRITIAARVHPPGRLTIEIRDDGVGLTPGAREGIGVGNVRRRLAQLYAGDATFTLAPGDGGGTAVTIEMPLELAPASAAAAGEPA